MKTPLQGDDLSRAVKARADEIQAADLGNGTKTKRGAALNTASRELGFRDWNTASAHAKSTRQVSATAQLLRLPAELKSLLDDAAAGDPASPETLAAFQRGFVFAIDVKDAPRLDEASVFFPADDGWHVASRDTWIELVHEPDFETGRSLADSADLSVAAEVAMDDVQNYRLFRYTGPSTPATLSEAYALVMQISFFAPTHVWLGGQFISLSKVPEIRVDGQVVYSTTPPEDVALKAPTPEAAKLWHLLNDAERKLFPSMAVAEQSFLLHDAKKRTPYGKGRFQSVVSSVTTTWSNAVKPK